MKIKLVLLASLIAIGSNAFADQTTGNLTLRANVVPVCKISDADLNFGRYDATDNSNLVTTAQTTVVCSNTVAYDVKPGVDTNLENGTDVLPVILEADNGAGIFLQWDNTHSFTGVGTDFMGTTHTIRGTIAHGQYVSPGNYSKTTTMTVTF